MHPLKFDTIGLGSKANCRCNKVNLVYLYRYDDIRPRVSAKILLGCAWMKIYSRSLVSEGLGIDTTLMMK
jgi:hypothetical protein